MKFRAKPIEVEAFQYDGDFTNSDGEFYVPQWAVDALKEDKLYFNELNGVPCELFIDTPESAVHVALDNYVIKADDGTLYTLRPNVFEKLYERIEE